MIPSFNASMVLPPFVGENPGARASMAPYKVSMLEVVTRFATTPARVDLLQGLLSYRRALLDLGIERGFQWLDGSFVEDVETARRRPPADIDLVTFAANPHPKDVISTSQWMRTNIGLFDPRQTKATFKCDAFFVDLDKRPDLLVDDTRYWFGLFSHQRETTLWKGMLQVPIVSDDAQAFEYLGGAENPEKENLNA